MKNQSSYVAPTLTVDLVAFQVLGDKLCVLLHRRPNDPFKGEWALPGGYAPAGETTREALSRVVLTKIGVEVETDFSYLAQLHAFDTVARDPRGHAVSVTYIACGYGIQLPGMDYETAFIPLSELPDIAYDHAAIILFARQYLIERLAHTTVASAFLPPSFTLTELQTVHEAISGSKLDKRNFRKKILKEELLEATGTRRENVAARPAQLYRFISDSKDDPQIPSVP